MNGSFPGIVDGVSNGSVAIQRDCTEVEDACCWISISISLVPIISNVINSNKRAGRSKQTCAAENVRSEPKLANDFPQHPSSQYGISDVQRKDEDRDGQVRHGQRHNEKVGSTAEGTVRKDGEDDQNVSDHGEDNDERKCDGRYGSLLCIR